METIGPVEVLRGNCRVATSRLRSLRAILVTLGKSARQLKNQDAIELIDEALEAQSSIEGKVCALTTVVANLGPGGGPTTDLNP